MGDGMRERPILMTPENAQKCHDGTKTQTRRIVKPQPFHISWFEHQQGWCAKVREDTGSAEHPAYVMVPCPYGLVGDRLWVREPFTVANEGREDQSVIYKGDPMFSGMTVFDWKWTPSIHMPRFACRTVLEITDVRVERLQDITTEDIKREGIEWSDEPETADIYYQRWRHLWESINGKGSWDLNPWVWVIAFRKVGT